MEVNDNREILISGINELGVQIDSNQLDSFDKFMFLMLEWNEKINLTAITDSKSILVKHFMDSITPLLFINKYNLDFSSILDMGTGAGFPGIPLKIILPDTSLVLVDSLKKRINYLEVIIDELNLENVSTVHGRAEEVGQDQTLRQNSTIVLSRAVASMKVLAEYCLPLVKVGGYFLAFKGPGVKEELNDAKNAFKILGGEIIGVENLQLPLINDPRTLVFVKKIKATPNKYPRRPGIPKKAPL
ncbi:MAG: 16S rRNA (guanine(527)-N(7))-methyltransferase RsmG [Halanaerobiales bacterium]|nr:16S rRNA (guanine(527)-N(7))-methyltransferase RsmG [Halanaerobiales bacterium]